MESIFITKKKIREIVFYEYDFNAYNKNIIHHGQNNLSLILLLKNIRDFKDVKKSNGACQVETHVVLHVQQCVVRIGNHQDGIMCSSTNTSGAKKLANEMDDL